LTQIEAFATKERCGCLFFGVKHVTAEIKEAAGGGQLPYRMRSFELFALQISSPGGKHT
jgi:hypothetical protein